MTEVLQILISNVSSAFTAMSNFEVLPGVSLLSFSIIILVISVGLKIFWINFKVEDNTRGDKKK